MGLTGHRNNTFINNDLTSFVDSAPVPQSDDSTSHQDNEYHFSHLNKHIHPNQQLRDKGYSIYVVDDEHEIHRFDIDSYEWSIISTTKD